MMAARPRWLRYFDEPYTVVGANLEPFHSVRGLSQVSISLLVTNDVNMLTGLPKFSTDKWTAGAREVLDTVERIMMSPRV